MRDSTQMRRVYAVPGMAGMVNLKAVTNLADVEQKGPRMSVSGATSVSPHSVPLRIECSFPEPAFRFRTALEVPLEKREWFPPDTIHAVPAFPLRASAASMARIRTMDATGRRSSRAIVRIRSSSGFGNWSPIIFPIGLGVLDFRARRAMSENLEPQAAIVKSFLGVSNPVNL